MINVSVVFPDNFVSTCHMQYSQKYQIKLNQWFTWK